MDLKIPTVSIGLPVYNGENYLKEAMDSILSQSFGDFELIISDNASTDRTMAICRSYADKDSRIHFYRNENNLGAAWNFNHVFHLARGKYFQWACHDDVWTPTLLERYVDILNRMIDVVLCYSKTMYIDDSGIPIRNLIGRPNLEDADPHQRFRSYLKYHIGPNECNPVLGLFRADVLKQTPLTGNYPASDMVLLGEVLLHGKFHEIPESLFLRRDHPGTSVRANPKPEERAVFLDPNQKGKIQLPTCRWFYEWMKCVYRSPVGILEGIRCEIELCKWAKWNRGKLKMEIKYGVKKTLHLSTPAME
jgi:glycosyltransferase involved in cell wall biosynthesis